MNIYQILNFSYFQNRKMYPMNKHVRKFQFLNLKKNDSFIFKIEILRGEILKMIPCKTTALRWKSYLQYHLVLILSQDKTSIHEEHFPCSTFHTDMVYQRETKNVQRGPRYKKSRCPWDGIYLRTSIMFRTGGKPSTWFPPVELVELYVLRSLKFLKLKNLFVFFENSTFPKIPKDLSKITPSSKFWVIWKSQ